MVFVCPFNGTPRHQAKYANDHAGSGYKLNMSEVPRTPEARISAKVIARACRMIMPIAVGVKPLGLVMPQSPGALVLVIDG
jgi:hypothetical protein